MQIPGIPANEQERLQALREYELLDSESEKEFDEIVSLASFICQTPISTITLIDEHRQWFKAQVGLANRETPRDVAFCAFAILQPEITIVNDATLDKRFRENPLVTGSPDIRFYAGLPLTTPEGFNLGTICVIDTRPRDLTDEQNLALRVLRNQVLKLFELRRKNILLTRMHAMQQKLLSIIGHDLRGPINSLNGLLLMVEKYKLSTDDLNEILPRMRMMVDTTDDLLNNLLHWAKNHLEGKVAEHEAFNLHTLVADVTHGLKSVLAEKDNELNIHIDPAHTVVVNRNIFEFILRNLIANANKFTSQGRIQVFSAMNGAKALITVCDNGMGIRPERISALFEWGKSNSTKGTKGETGSGLGLPMVREFVEQMGGKIWVESTPGKSTAFHFTVPIKRDEASDS
ncbi:ATP-binding protein [Ohtaekwangia kribbensis]|jgi:signal transduction histidine kinase|uniref:histidine kinase n=1 Tax=Ohtaekwangia kribbensis TaxID=688913 RepID=A0ABW3KBC7_9BACT